MKVIQWSRSINWSDEGGRLPSVPNTAIERLKNNKLEFKIKKNLMYNINND